MNVCFINMYIFAELYICFLKIANFLIHINPYRNGQSSPQGGGGAGSEGEGKRVKGEEGQTGEGIEHFDL